MLAIPKGLSDEKAARIMAALREGQTLLKFGVKPARLDAYFAANPGYAQEARPLIEANAKAARQRKGSLRSTLTHCKYGHPFSGDNLYLAPGRKERKCLACLKRRGQRERRMSEQQARRVVEALNEGKTQSPVLPRPVNPTSSIIARCFCSDKSIRRLIDLSFVAQRQTQKFGTPRRQPAAFKYSGRRALPRKATIFLP
jgi:hypothetical protein